MIKKRIQLLLSLIILVFFFGNSCGLFGDEEEKDLRNQPGSPLYPQPYVQPSVSPDGSNILFIRNKITRITKSGFYSIDPDSSGIWLANADGTNMKQLLQGQHIGSPSFSPDMEWILFEAGAQIYKVPYSNRSIDTTGFVQLTNAGRNFFPVWSPDGQWIAYDRSIEDDFGPAGIWRMKQDGNEKENLFGGAFPAWHPDGSSILAVIGTSATSVWKRFKIFTINTGSTEILKAVVDANNLHPKYSQNGNHIVFQSNIQIWTMDARGSNVHQLAENGVEPAWYPDGRIIYIKYYPHDFSLDNGTIWSMNADGSGKVQLTQNFGLVLEE